MPFVGDTQGMRQTVLVVDDQDIVRDVVRLALDLVRGDGAIDLLMTDVVMPEMDAFELADRIACEVPGVRVLYTSGYTDAGAEGHFIQKPFTPAELVEK